MIGYLEHHIVDHCNLNCAGCSHFSPLAPQWFEQIEQFCTDFKALAQTTQGQIGTIRLMGGEPLLHPQVGEFARTARELFPNSEIQVVTNGILLEKRKEELMPIFNQYKIGVCVSNYGLKLDLNQITAGFDKVRIDWKQEMYNIALIDRSCISTATLFANCDLHQYKWYYFQNGKFYHCCIGANIEIFNHQFNRHFPQEDGITVIDHTVEEIEEYLSKPVSLCSYCNTLYRMRSNHAFALSKKKESEGTCQ